MLSMLWTILNLVASTRLLTSQVWLISRRRICRTMQMEISSSRIATVSVLSTARAIHVCCSWLLVYHS